MQEQSQPFVITPVGIGPVIDPEITLSPINTEVNMSKAKLKPSECPVTVSIKWADRTKTKVLPPDLSAVGTLLCSVIPYKYTYMKKSLNKFIKNVLLCV